jgi:beta-lactamase regulating signal transducer with metallopeptidase domain
LSPSLRRGTPPPDAATTARPAGFALANLSFNFTPRLSRELAIGVVGVWLAGALIGLVGLVASIVRVRGLKKRSSPLEGDLADELPWLTDVAAGREIYLRLSFETETPVAIGFRRPVILIPTELASAAGLVAIESLILHEHAHLRRYDDWTNLVQRTIERIFWFNPVVWLVGRRIALEREIASDDAVVEKTGAAHAYATSLWRLAREMRMPEHAVVAPGALLTRKQISLRIELLLDKNRARLHGSPAASFGVVLAGLVAVGFVATSAPAVELPAAAPLAPPTRIVLPEGSNPPHQRIVIVGKQTVTPPSVPLVAVGPLPRVAPLPPVAAPPSVPPMRHALIDVDVAAIVHDALADVPMQIADEAGMAHGGRTLAGVKLTRDLIAACKGCSMRNADLRGLDLHGLTLTGDDMSGADLRGANLAGAVLRGVSLTRANLSTADLRGAVLTGANLSRADLRDANLANVHFNGVDFAHANLTGSDLTGASLNGCDLTGISLHGAKTAGMTMQGTGLDG